MQIACRIHACAYPRKEKEREKEGRNQGPEKNVRIASTKGGIRDTLFISFPPSFSFLFVFFFLRDDVIARRSAGCYVREKIGAVGKREFAKGEGSFCEKKEKEKKEKSRIRWKPPPFEMNI